MELTAAIALVIGCLSILGTVISTVWFFGRLRWEVDTLKRENNQQEQSLKEISEAIKALREKGSAPTESLEKRMTKLEEKFDAFSEKINASIAQLIVEIRTAEKTPGQRRRRNDA